MKTTILAAIAAIALSACGQKSSFQDVENQRDIANRNSLFNATAWRGNNGYAEAGLLGRGDSTQDAKCPQGDGWASIDVIDPKTKQVLVPLKCSTVSANLGCWTATDFKARPNLAGQENNCNADLPTNLPKIEK